MVTSPLLVDSFLNVLQLDWSPEKSEEVSTRCDQAAIHLLESISELLSDIHGYANDIQLRTFFDGDGTGIAVRFAPYTDLITTWIYWTQQSSVKMADEDKQTLRWSENAFWDIWFDIQHCFPELRPQIQAEVSLSPYETRWECQGSNEFVYKLCILLGQRRRSEQCCAPDCTETWSSADRKFRFCTGCGRASYCSNKCQKSAWKHADLPHKQVCRLLSSMVKAEIIPFNASLDDDDPYFSKCKKRLEDDSSHEEEFKSIVCHLEGLQRRKMDALGTVITFFDAHALTRSNRTKIGSAMG